ncbi:hypothetical protein LX36DRAFT_663147 [Colletotrichum falcatum]|nr:hypothetical protein LX36DRAFT_663147 [Colletotrichum falcatum]
MHHLALVTAFEALERAGSVISRTVSSCKTRVGTCYGQASGSHAFGPGRINCFFKFSGPSFSCDTACSLSPATAHVGIHTYPSMFLGCRVSSRPLVLLFGMARLIPLSLEAQTSSTSSDAFASLSNGRFLPKTPDSSKTRGVEADGYCRADGVVSFVMKRLEDAEKDNDNMANKSHVHPSYCGAG